MVLLVIILMAAVVAAGVATFAQLSVKDTLSDITELKTLCTFLFVLVVSNFAMLLYLIDQLQL
jgi:hypothetical protein